MNKIPPLVRNIGAGLLLAFLLFFAYKFTLGKEVAPEPLVEQGPSVAGLVTAPVTGGSMGDAGVIRDAHRRLTDLSDIDTTILDSEAINSLKDARIPLSQDGLSPENIGRTDPFAPTSSGGRTSTAR